MGAPMIDAALDEKRRLTAEAAGLLNGPEEAFQAFLARARSGDESTAPVIRAMLEGDRDGVLTRLLGGDPAILLEQVLTERSAGKNVAVGEARTRYLAETRAGVAGPGASPLERLLAARVMHCWCVLCQAEAEWAVGKREGWSLRQADYAQRNIDRAHRRLLSAAGALAKVRQLSAPPAGVSVRQEVNLTVAPAGAAEAGRTDPAELPAALGRD